MDRAAKQGPPRARPGRWASPPRAGARSVAPPTGRAERKIQVMVDGREARPHAPDGAGVFWNVGSSLRGVGGQPFGRGRYPQMNSSEASGASGRSPEPVGGGRLSVEEDQHASSVAHIVMRMWQLARRWGVLLLLGTGGEGDCGDHARRSRAEAARSSTLRLKAWRADCTFEIGTKVARA